MEIIPDRIKLTLMILIGDALITPVVDPGVVRAVDNFPLDVTISADNISLPNHTIPKHRLEDIQS